MKCRICKGRKDVVQDKKLGFVCKECLADLNSGERSNVCCPDNCLNKDEECADCVDSSRFRMARSLFITNSKKAHVKRMIVEFIKSQKKAVRLSSIKDYFGFTDYQVRLMVRELKKEKRLIRVYKIYFGLQTISLLKYITEPKLKESSTKKVQDQVTSLLKRYGLDTKPITTEERKYLDIASKIKRRRKQ